MESSLEIANLGKSKYFLSIKGKNLDIEIGKETIIDATKLCKKKKKKKEEKEKKEKEKSKKEEKGKKVKKLFPTCDESFKIKYNSNTSDEFIEWISNAIYTIWIQSEKKTTQVSTIRSSLRCDLAPLSCIYLINLGTVKQFRNKMDISKDHKDDDDN